MQEEPWITQAKHGMATHTERGRGSALHPRKCEASMLPRSMHKWIKEYLQMHLSHTYQTCKSLIRGTKQMNCGWILLYKKKKNLFAITGFMDTTYTLPGSLRCCITAFALTRVNSSIDAIVLQKQISTSVPIHSAVMYSLGKTGPFYSDKKVHWHEICCQRSRRNRWLVRRAHLETNCHKSAFSPTAVTMGSGSFVWQVPVLILAPIPQCPIRTTGDLHRRMFLRAAVCPVPICR